LHDSIGLKLNYSTTHFSSCYCHGYQPIRGWISSQASSLLQTWL